MNPEIGDSKEEDGKTLYWTGEQWMELPDLTDDYPQVPVTFPGILKWTSTNPPPQK